MIAYVRGRLHGPADAREVRIETERAPVVARTYAPPGGLAPGDDVVAAAARIAAGIVDHDLTALLGPWPSDRPDPSAPLGLASTPVILLPTRALVDIARAGVARAGRAPMVKRLEAPTPHLGLELLEATGAGAEVVVLTESRGRHVDLVRILNGRAVVALPSSDGHAIAAWLDDAELGADLPIPTTDRDAARTIASLGLEATHQLVQVDPTPAFDEAGASSDGDFAISAAAAAGVLAGRIAVGNRRWRAEAAP
jgi:hypothetical protein